MRSIVVNAQRWPSLLAGLGFESEHGVDPLDVSRRDRKGHCKLPVLDTLLGLAPCDAGQGRGVRDAKEHHAPVGDCPASTGDAVAPAPRLGVNDRYGVPVGSLRALVGKGLLGRLSMRPKPREQLKHQLPVTFTIAVE
ncbi:hypothetical protein ACFPRL_31840 [Pseudoclavibacter helvolus]